MRSTVQIRDLVDVVNQRNRKSTCPPDVRQGWNSLLEDVLHKAEAYEGYGYLMAGEVPSGQLPGIVRDQEDNPTFPDETRRIYYLNPKLAKPH